MWVRLHHTVNNNQRHNIYCCTHCKLWFHWGHNEYLYSALPPGLKSYMPWLIMWLSCSCRVFVLVIASGWATEVLLVYLDFKVFTLKKNSWQTFAFKVISSQLVNVYAHSEWLLFCEFGQIVNMSALVCLLEPCFWRPALGLVQNSLNTHTHIHTLAPLKARLLETRGPKCLTDGLLTNTTLCLGPQVFPVFGLAVIYSILT